MKPYSRFILAATLAWAPAAAVQAANAGTNSAPVPTKIVHPMNIPRHYENAVVEIVFTLDAAGVPRNVATLRNQPAELTKQLIPAVSAWRFTPYYKDGKPVSVRVVLPLRLVERDIVALVEYPAGEPSPVGAIAASMPRTSGERGGPANE